MATVATTKLEAVNTILSAIAQESVTALAATQDATDAETMLDEVSRRVQSEGWRYNSIKKDITAGSSGHVVLPTNTLRFDWPRKNYNDPELVLRQVAGGGDLQAYDVDEDTNTFTVGAVFKDCEIVVGLDFDELPESARQFIMISAARQFQDRVLGSNSRSRYTRQDEFDARRNMRREEALTGDYNIFNTGVPMRALRRSSYFSRGY